MTPKRDRFSAGPSLLSIDASPAAGAPTQCQAATSKTSISAIRTRFRRWWHAPITLKERMSGLLVGAFAGFWLGLFGRLWLATMPVAGSEVIAYAAVGILVFAVAGYFFPKAATIVLFLFAVIGTN